MSSSGVIIHVDRIGKVYRIYDQPSQKLFQIVFSFISRLIGSPEKCFYKKFTALENVSFQVARGETLGILGVNGAGKSTLLQIVAGIVSPTHGSIEIRGRVVALLELGAGFNFEFSGKENIYIYGAILGLSREEIDNRFERIIEFSEIGDFVNLPVKTYSSGMFARLAFAVAINIDPDILIVDETLSVGDLRFQQKCLRRIDQLKKQGCTIIYVSHDLSSVLSICNRAILLHEGNLILQGHTKDVAEKYFEIINFKNLNLINSSEQTSDSKKISDQILDISHLPRLGGDRINVIGAAFLNDEGVRVDKFGQGDVVELNIEFLAKEDLDEIFIGFMLKNERGIDIFGCNSLVNQGVYKVVKDCRYIYAVKFNIPHLINNRYLVDVAISRGKLSDHIHYCWVHDALIVDVRSGDDRFSSHAVIGLPRNQIYDERVKMING